MRVFVLLLALQSVAWAPGVAGTPQSGCKLKIANCQKCSLISGCKTCAANHYSVAKEAKAPFLLRRCTACPSKSTSAPGSTSISGCKCVPGFYWQNGGCSQCPGFGQAAGTSAPGATSINNCTCPGGAELYAGTCRCPAGTYRSGDACQACPAGATSPPASGAVTDCACTATANSWLDTSAPPTCRVCSNGVGTGKQCVCNKNFFFSSVAKACQSCPGSSITDGPGATDVSACKCPPNTYGSASTCTPCPSGSTAPADSANLADCACTDPNSWLDTSGTPTCRVCSNGVGTGKSCICWVGYYLSNVTEICEQCAGAATTANVGSTDISQCICPENTYGENLTGFCTMCPPGATVPAGTATAVTGCTCTATPNSWLDINSLPEECRVCTNGVGSGQQCVCNQGFKFDTTTKSCIV